MQTTEEYKITDALASFVEKWREKPGNLIMILHKAQSEYGFIPRKIAIELGRILDVPLAKIYGVITFYNFFKLEKPGKHNIQVCTGTACYLKGGIDIIEELEILLGTGVNTVTDDGLFSIESVRCIGCCGLAPVLLIDGEIFGKLSKDDLPKIIADIRDR